MAYNQKVAEEHHQRARTIQSQTRVQSPAHTPRDLRGTRGSYPDTVGRTHMTTRNSA